MIQPNLENFDPNMVFTPEYWGETVKTPETTNHAIIAKTKIPRALVARYGAQIISGEITGPQAPKGTVFDFADSELTQSSFYNYPNSLLLVDMERVRSHVFNEFDEAEEVRPAMDFVCPPRNLLQITHPREYWNQPEAIPEYGVQHRNLFADTEKYSRVVFLMATAEGRKGIVDPRKVLKFTPRTETFPGESLLMSVSAFMRRVEIGQTYEASHSDEEGERPGSKFRIRSVEAAMTGSPVAVKRKLFNFAGRMATHTNEA